MFNHVNYNVSKYRIVLLEIEPELCYTMRISVHCIGAHGVFVASASKFHETFTNSALRRVSDCNQEIGKCVCVAFSPDILCSSFMSGRSERARDILRNDDARARVAYQILSFFICVRVFTTLFGKFHRKPARQTSNSDATVHSTLCSIFFV